MDADSAVVTLHIRLKRDASGYPPFDAEEVEARHVGEHQYELVRPPLFAHGLAVGDTVGVWHDTDGSISTWIDSLVSAGGHSTFRAIGLGGQPADRPRRIAEQLGCTVVEGHTPGMIAVDVPPTADVVALYSAFAAGRDAGSWDFDIGVLSDEHNALLGDGT